MHHVDHDASTAGDNARAAMWRQVLDVQLACIKKAPQLADPVIEAVKNALLVMDALGQFGPAANRNDLWRTTWAAIDPVLPKLREELFPAPPPPVAPVPGPAGRGGGRGPSGRLCGSDALQVAAAATSAHAGGSRVFGVGGAYDLSGRSEMGKE
ncbi:hypothetical protein AMAG_19830 [Allomyces macrogynus ATCC 38327]|uniref:Uncharacterized protein n=1 Tax=Allomyces macrogynus (strain ATCC 38327) TaxID=578462 RepID=A0A0L0SZU2_ALLM3|nr:hypothetical protein AMAG_19830 [Allomyces macrogynus ATCC 38327]|eukprot:KNE68001.1 hypothetical protein AMAG_19830 [Allomyces macrogynus ATCC 38327]